MEDTLLIGICDGAIEKKKDTYYYTNKTGGCAVRFSLFFQFLVLAVMLKVLGCNGQA